MVRFLADFKKRNAERKGGKKEEIKSKKLMEDNLDDLIGQGRRREINNIKRIKCLRWDGLLFATPPPFQNELTRAAGLTSGIAP